MTCESLIHKQCIHCVKKTQKDNMVSEKMAAIAITNYAFTLRRDLKKVPVFYCL